MWWAGWTTELQNYIPHNQDIISPRWVKVSSLLLSHISSTLVSSSTRDCWVSTSSSWQTAGSGWWAGLSWSSTLRLLHSSWTDSILVPLSMQSWSTCICWNSSTGRLDTSTLSTSLWTELVTISAGDACAGSRPSTPSLLTIWWIIPVRCPLLATESSSSSDSLLSLSTTGLIIRRKSLNSPAEAATSGLARQSLFQLNTLQVTERKRRANFLSGTMLLVGWDLIYREIIFSGFWGLSRHMNYVFELMLALSWSGPALGYGVVPFFYWWFLLILLVHRYARCSAQK